MKKISKVTKWRLKQLGFLEQNLEKICDLVSIELLDREISVRKAFWIVKQKYFTNREQVENKSGIGYEKNKNKIKNKT